MAKTPNEVGYDKIIKCFQEGISPSTVSFMFDLKDVTPYQTVYKSVRDGVYTKTITALIGFAKECADSMGTIVPEDPAKMKTKAPEPVKSEPEAPKAESKPSGNEAIAITRILEEIHSVDEHLLQLMDADMPRAVAMLNNNPDFPLNDIVEGISESVTAFQMKGFAEAVSYLKKISESVSTIASSFKSMESKIKISECEEQIIDCLERCCRKDTERALHDKTIKAGFTETEFTTAINRLVASGKVVRKSTGNGSKLTIYELRT